MIGKSQAKQVRNKKGVSRRRFFVHSSYIRSYAHNGRLKQMEADNKKGA